jgi:hypothetical protein
MDELGTWRVRLVMMPPRSMRAFLLCFYFEKYPYQKSYSKSESGNPEADRAHLEKPFSDGESFCNSQIESKKEDHPYGIP